MNTRSQIQHRTTSKEPKLLCASFNQNQDCFAVGHENGFRVYGTDPMVLRVKRIFNSANSSKSLDRSGIGHISMLHHTNFLSLVGGGKNPKFPLNKVIIYDDFKKKNTLSLEFMSPVLNVFLSRTRIVVVLSTHVYVYAFSSPPKQIAAYETTENPTGVADLSNSMPQTRENGTELGGSSSGGSSSNNGSGHINEILAFPGRSVGQIQIVDISPVGQERNLVSIIKAHKARIRCLAINRAGTMVASASETGTIIRVHSISNCALLYEFRRGLDKAVIFSMKFSPNGSKLAVLSDKQTLHVFRLPEEELMVSGKENGRSLSNNSTNSTETDNNRRHMLKNIPIFTNYFNSQWSFVSCHLNQPSVSNPSVVPNKDKYNEDLNVNNKINDSGIIGWSGELSIVIVWKFRGKWEKYTINHGPEGYALVREAWKSFGDLNE